MNAIIIREICYIFKGERGPIGLPGAPGKTGAQGTIGPPGEVSCLLFVCLFVCFFPPVTRYNLHKYSGPSQSTHNSYFCSLQ